MREDKCFRNKDYVNLPNGKRISFGYLSRIANNEKPITLEQFEKTHLWSTLDEAEKMRIRSSFTSAEHDKENKENIFFQLYPVGKSKREIYVRADNGSLECTCYAQSQYKIK